ncbi:sensor histidine kinase [Flavobacterium tegetincola]|uniref:sensor histidine kinase n=1 Tax=Flavobacterium tegetincola TaxID=150172 RepID=UPI00146C23F7|nr:histidine kinase [Flavobacterium tegetincola]
MKSLAKSHQLEIDKKNSELKNQFEISHSIIKSQEDERERIARDMHDGFMGELLRMQFKVEMKQELTASELKELVSKTRRIIHDVSPPMVNESPIDVLIASEADKYAASFPYQLYKNRINLGSNMTADYKINLFRIFQELLQNTFKHSKVSHVKISIYERPGLLLFVYQDCCVLQATLPSTAELGGNGHKNIAFRNQYLKANFKFKRLKDSGLKYLMLLKINS